LADRLRELGRQEGASEEFARLVANSSPEEPSTEKWRKLRGLGALDRRRLAIARGLYRWREEMAARTNRPARAMVRDDLIVEIARRNPARERDLSVIRGLPKRNITAMLQVIQDARALPLEQCPVAAEREQDPPQVALI